VAPKKIINEWKISKKCHALYYGKVVDVPCPGEARVIRGKPSWMPVSAEQWYRTSPVVKWNRGPTDELLSVETASRHTYWMGTKYAKPAGPAQPQQAAVVIQPAMVQPAPLPQPAGQTPQPPTSAAIGYDLGASLGGSPNSLLSLSPEETMEFIVDPTNKTQ
jgi:hypothetical protein